jgi:hypothetical protein
MSCGTKLEGRFYSYSEREDLADALEREGEYRLAQSVKRGDCLGYSELDRAKSALDWQGVSRWDYNESECRCSHEEEEQE